jgi:hypothetical protein
MMTMALNTSFYQQGDSVEKGGGVMVMVTILQTTDYNIIDGNNFMQKPLLIITTGGTIGAVAQGECPPSHVTFAPAPQNTVRDALYQPIFGLTASDYDLLEMEQRDSKDIDDTYMQQLVQHVVTANHPNILVTFGTDALLRAAAVMHQAMTDWAAAGHDKTVILTGSMLPLANGLASDGWQNLQWSIDLLLGRAKNPCNASVSIVLSDYGQQGMAEGEEMLWRPRQYPYIPNAYVKYYDPVHPHRSRLILSQHQAKPAC